MSWCRTGGSRYICPPELELGDRDGEHRPSALAKPPLPPAWGEEFLGGPSCLSCLLMQQNNDRRRPRRGFFFCLTLDPKHTMINQSLNIFK